MSYNPNRQNSASNPKRQRRIDPRAGHRHNEIIAKYGPQAATIDDIRNREQTKRGWRVTVLKGNDFEMFYEYICSRNTTGLVKHPTKDRALRLLSGELFITANGEVLHLRAGSSYALPKELEYQISTSGVADAELIFCQGSDYEEGLEQISESEINDKTNMTFATPVDIPSKDIASLESARKYAAQLQEEKKKRERDRQHGVSRVVDEQAQAVSQGAESVVTSTRRVPPRRQQALPGQLVSGVNPRPMGSGGFGED